MRRTSKATGVGFFKYYSGRARPFDRLLTGKSILTTEMAPKPDKKTGRGPTGSKETAGWQHLQPDHEGRRMLEGKGLAGVAEDKIQVTAVKGPLGGGLAAQKVEAFAARIPIRA